MCAGGGRGRQVEAGEVGGGKRGQRRRVRSPEEEGAMMSGLCALSQALPLPLLYIFKPHFSQSHLSKWTNYLAYVQE